MQLLASLLAVSSLAQASNLRIEARNETITEESFFYGQSPPVYPTPEMTSNGTWAVAYDKAMALVRQMTTEEKVNVTLGQKGTSCTGATGGVPRLGYPGLCFNGATAGVKQQELVNGYPGGIHSGASWNRDMNYERAVHMAREFRAKGAHLQGAPLIGPLGRLPRGGRNNGGFSNDPYLAGQLAGIMVEGIVSQGVQATAKHFIGYEQESYRIRNGNKTSAVSSNIDDRTMHEQYLWPWADVVRAGVPSVMCSYNKVNNSQACQNSKALNGLLKGELGFQGWVMTDWTALTGGYAAAAAGLDAVLPTPSYWGTNGSSLVEAVNNGSMAESRLNDMAARIITPWFYLGQDFGYTPGGWGTTLTFDQPHRKVYARDPASKDVILQNAMEGHVLVKNINNALPLKKPQMISIFGYDAPSPNLMNIPSPADSGIGWSYGAESTDPLVVLEDMMGFKGYSPAAARNGTLIHGGASEASAPAYIHAPFDAIKEQAYIDGTSLWWDFVSENPLVNPNTDACLVFINAWATEGADRADDFSDNLVKNVATNCSNTMVFIHNAGPRLVDEWIDHPNVTAVMFAHLPGQDSGRSLAKLIYGEVSPSGKLPYTVAKAEEDYGELSPSLPEGKYAKFPQSDFTEGIYTDYRRFDKLNITPRYEFGFGMTYTTFNYTDLQIRNQTDLSNVPERPPYHPTQPGGNPALWDVMVSVVATVKNTGDVDAAEVAQLYLEIPGDDVPQRQLRGFDKKTILVGYEAMMSFSLTRRDLSIWDVVQQDWVLRRGTYGIYVGPSSRNLALHTTFEV